MFSQYALLLFGVITSFQDPFDECKTWFSEEKKTQHHVCACLSTISPEHKAQGRIVDIVEWDERGALFFTHANTEKVKALNSNSSASLNVWLAVTKKQVTISGTAVPISKDECIPYWKRFPRPLQLGFIASDHCSEIESLDPLREKLQELSASETIPMPDEFLGYRLVPDEFVFFEVQPHDFPLKHVFKKEGSSWNKQLMAP